MIEKICARLVREMPLIHSEVKSGSQVLKLVIDQFYNYRCYSVTITLQIEKYSLIFAHIALGHDKSNFNNDRSTFPNETSYVESMSSAASRAASWITSHRSDA